VHDLPSKVNGSAAEASAVDVARLRGRGPRVTHRGARTSGGPGAQASGDRAANQKGRSDHPSPGDGFGPAPPRLVWRSGRTAAAVPVGFRQRREGGDFAVPAGPRQAALATGYGAVTLSAGLPASPGDPGGPRGRSNR